MTEAPEALHLFFSLAGRLQGDGAPVRVIEGRSEIKSAKRAGSVREFVRLPSTGGAFVLASLGSSASFSTGLEALTLSRPVWLVARRVLSVMSIFGVHKCLGLPHFAVAGSSASTEYSLQMGVPGGGQKLVVREWCDDEDHAFWKLGTAGLPAQLVEAETAALQWLGDNKLDGVLAPELLGSGADQDASWLKMQAMTGARPSSDVAGVAEGFLGKLASAAAVEMPLAQSPWLEGLQTRLEQIKKDAPDLAQACRVALDEVVAGMGERALSFCPSHGDFTPWNAKVQDGCLRAFDWEFFSACAPALSDWFHWIVQTGVLVEHLSVEQLRAKLMAPTALSTFEKGEPRETYLRLYLIDAISREEWVMQHGRPEFKQVEWLRKARLELLCGGAA